jgi:hypothetical protein
MLVGITLALGIAAIAFLAQPIQAYFHGNSEGTGLQTRDRSRLKTSDCDECGNSLQRRNQSREMLGTHDCACKRTDVQQQTQTRQRTAACTMSRVQYSEMTMNQIRSGRRENTRIREAD